MAAVEHVCTVRSNRLLTPTVFELAFETDQPIRYRAGQFISIVIPGAGPKGRDLRRAYSIASAPQHGTAELCIKIVEGGSGTGYLQRLKPGDVFRGFAPYGDFVFDPKPGRHACFVATGTGISPFRSILTSEEYQARLPARTTCLLGVREEVEILYDHELAALPFLKWVPAVSRPSPAWKGFKGRVTDYLRSLGEDFPWLETEYFLCGSSVMIEEAKKILAEKRVPRERVHQEVYYRP